MNKIRSAFAVVFMVTAGGPAGAAPEARPTQVAGIEIPRGRLAREAEKYIRSVEPDFLINHSMRTFVFGALRMKGRHLAYDAETAYVAALFHDLGLVQRLASDNGSFETDGATRAEDFVKANGGTNEQARIVWNAIVMHDMGRLYQSHQTPEAQLVGAGAGADVNGVDPKEIPSAVVGTVLQAYPRLQFKKRFTAAAIDHCRRKPMSQIGWLDELCRDTVPNIDRGSVEEGIASAPFAE